jgi:hypothetical protein
MEDCAMILNSSKDKIEFLEGCFLHINCIFKTLNDKDLKLQNVSRYQKNNIDCQEASLLADRNLPDSIVLNGNFPTNNYDVGKLLVLISLYNNVVAHIVEENQIDLESEFNKVKQDLHFTLLSSGLPGADILMKKQQHYFLRDSVLGYILSFIWTPKSSNFLTKYEFFTKESDWEDDFNFRYDLASNCHFDVKLISQIEPIGMGLGYIIKAKSSEEASIIMKAIRLQVDGDKLEDSIRFVDAKDLSSKIEGSSTIEVWGQAVDALDTLIENNLSKLH